MRRRMAPAGTMFLRMLAIVLVVTAVWSGRALSAQSAPATLTSLRAIRALAKEQIRDDIPVAFEATVTFYNRGDLDLFVQDGDEAIYVESRRDEDVRPGDRVLVRGKTRKSFSVDIVGESVTVLHHGAVPAPAPADFEHLIRAELDCR